MAIISPEDLYASIEKLSRRVQAADPGTAQREIESIATTIEGIVPVISSDADIPAEIYYAYLGANRQPEWIATLINTSLTNWDATDRRFYLRAGTDSAYVWSNTLCAFPTGPFGQFHTFDPKGNNVTEVVLEFRARFTGNADYTTSGIGLLSTTPLNNLFGNTTTHFIQVLRNAGSWEVGSCDGAAISQTSGGSADGNFHDFRIVWATNLISFYVDDVATFSKATNLPTRPLGFALVGHASAGNVDVTAVKITWR